METSNEADERDEQIVDLPGDKTPSTVRESLMPRFTPRQRRIQLAVTISVVIMALAVIFGSAASGRGMSIALFGRQATPTPTLMPGFNLFYITLQPVWGKVAIDGHILARLPLIGEDRPLQLAIGLHILQWRAPPLLTQSCTITVPPSPNDTCSYNSSVSLASGLGAWVVRFSASLAMLAPTQRDVLLKAAQAVLDAQAAAVTVQPGEIYGVAAQGKMFSVANQPLRAALRFVLDTDPASKGSCIIYARDTGQGCSYAGQDCRLFCSDPPQPLNSGPPTQPVSSSSQAWDVLAAIVPTWNYATLAGQPVATAQSDEVSDGTRESDEFLQPLRIAWDGTAWHVTARISDTNQFENPFCGTTQDEAQSGVLLGQQLPSNLSMQWYYINEANHAAGCVGLLALIQAHPKTLPPSAYTVMPAYFLHRFGLLLAANALAHHLAPSLPVADGYDQQVAAHMVTQSKVLQNL